MLVPSFKVYYRVPCSVILPTAWVLSQVDLWVTSCRVPHASAVLSPRLLTAYMEALSCTEQIKSKEGRLVMGVCSTARSKQYKQWKEVDVKVTVLACNIIYADGTASTAYSRCTTYEPPPEP